MKCLIIGNLVLEEGEEGKELTGPAYHSAITAARLGYETYLVSKGTSFEKYQEALDKEDIKLKVNPSWRNTEIKKENGQTYLKGEAGKIKNLPDIEADIVHVAPFLDEVPINTMNKIDEVKNDKTIVSFDAEGFTRHVKEDGRIVSIPFKDKNKYLEKVDILKLNPKELYYLTGKKTLTSARNLLGKVKIVLLTTGEKGARIFYRKKYTESPPYETEKVDVRGAGSVYSVSFTKRYREVKDYEEDKVQEEDIINAGYFASAAASYSVEEEGIKGIKGEDKVEKRYEELRSIFLI